MITIQLPSFEQPAIGACLADLSPAECDALDFGVIGFDRATLVRAYNAFESAAAGLRPASVLGHPVFKVVAPCMNNALVAHRFADTDAAGGVLDAVIPYVLTLRMRPTKVLLRLVADPASDLRYVLVQRHA